MAKEKKLNCFGRPRFYWTVGVLLFIGMSLFLILWAPGFLVESAAGESSKEELTTTQRVTAVNFARQAVLLVVGGLIAVATLLITWSKHNLDRKGQDIDRKKQELDRDANWTSRYTEAITQLGAESSPSIRLGGIYALERIAQDSTRDRQAIFDVLSAFIRERSPVKEPGVSTASPVATTSKMESDVEAAVTVLGRRQFLADKENQFDLSRTYLGGAKLSDANLAQTNFEFSSLSGADLINADLTQANLLNAKLVNANIRGASLNGANLIRADLTRANFTNADLTGAVLYEATMSLASFAQATLHSAALSTADMGWANLEGADLSSSTLANVNLTAARLAGADLTDADLSGAFQMDSDEKVLITREYLRKKEVKGLDTVKGLPADRKDEGR